MPTLPSIPPELLQEYQREISQRNSQATVKRKSFALQKFFNWAEEKGHIPENPLAPSYDSGTVVVSSPEPKASLVTKGNFFKVGITVALVVLIFLLTKKVRLPIPTWPAPAASPSGEFTTTTSQPSPIGQVSQTASPAPGITGFEEKDPFFHKIYKDGVITLSGLAPALKAIGGLSISGETLTLQTQTASDGDIEINPDGAGTANFLFEGGSGNLLNAQAPNLTSGSLYYGVVANNATGYDLLRLQSGSNPVTRLSVDALGNTFVGGDLKVADDISTGGVERLTDAGALANITGYNQTSGNFSITQSPGNFASIIKIGTALSDVLTLTLDERPKPLYSNSDYSTLVLKRYDGGPEAYALFLDEGNARFDGQLQLGRFGSNPSAIGQGSLVFNTGDSTAYVWNGSSWIALGGGSVSGFWQRVGTALSPATITDDVLTGGTTAAASLVRLPGNTNTNAWFNLGTGNLGVGTTNPQATFDLSGRAIFAIGTRNLFISGGNTTLTGADNIALGTSALSSITSSPRNVAIGNYAGQSITSSSYSDNVLIGYSSGISTVSERNVFIGSYAGENNISGGSNTYVGYQAGRGASSNTAIANTAIGYRTASTNLTTGDEGVYIGFFAGGTVTSGDFNVLIGSSADVATGTIAEGVALGYSTSVGATGSTVVGSRSSTATSATNATAIGYDADIAGSAVSSVALGDNATIASSNSYSIALGANATTTAANQLVIGGTGTGISDVYIGEGVTESSPTAFTLNPSGGSGTDIAGANITIAGGKATGNAAGGSILFSTSDAGASGTTLQSLAAKGIINAGGNMGIGTTAPNNRLEALSTSAPQLRVAYDTSNYITLGTTSAGVATLTTTGTTPSLNLQSDGTANVNIAGGSSATGCTVDNSTGNLACSGNISGGSSGTQGFWQLNDKVISPANSTHDVAVGGTATSSALVRLPGLTNNHAFFNLGTGNVGIGVTNPTSFKVQVAGSVGPDADDSYDLGSSSLRWRDLYLGPTSLHLYSLAAETTTARDWKFAIQETDGATEGNLRILEGATEIVNITPAGNFGIGTTGPDAKLDVLATTEQLRLTYADGSAYSSFTVSSGGDLTIAPSGSDTSVTGTLSVSGNTTLGDASTDNVTFTARVNSVLEPDSGSLRDLGSSARRWATVYGDTGNFTTIAGTLTGGSTTASDWTINSDNATADTEDATLTFDRGTPATNAQFKWISTGTPSKLTSINTPFWINPDSGIDPSGTAALIVNQIQAQDIFTASASGTPRFVIKNDGNMGIGTTAPGAEIQVLDNISGGMSTQTLGYINSTSNAYTTGKLLNVDLTQSAATGTSVSGDIGTISFSPTYSTAVTTPAITGQVFDVSRSVTTNSLFTSTLTLSGALATFSDTALQTTGTLTSTADVVRIAQNYASNTGSALDITSAGTAGGFALRVNDDGTFTDSTPLVVTNAGNVGIGGTNPTASLDIAGSASTSNLLTYFAPLRSSFGGSAQGIIDASINVSGGLNTVDSRYIGLSSVLQDNYSGGLTNSSLSIYGYVEATHASGTKDTVSSFYADPYQTGAGATTLITGIYSGVRSSAGTITSMASFYGAANNRTGGTVNNNYGLYLASQASVGTNNYQIYSASTSPFVLLATGSVGIGDSAPDSPLEVLSTTTPQLRLTYTDTTVDTTFAVSSTGDLTIDALGGGTTEQLILADADTINIGGSGSTDVAYNVIGDSTSGASANVDSDDDLYIEGNLEVDGTIYATISATDLTCTDCLDFTDFEDTLDLDNTLVVNQGTNTWTQNFTGDTTTGLTYNANSLTTGTGVSLASTSNAIDSGILLNVSSSASAATDTTLSADIANLSFSPIYSTAVTTPAITGQVLDVTRSVTTNSSFVSTLTLSGALASFSDSATQTTGTLTSTADVVRIAQNYTSNTGSALDITSAGTAGGFALRVNDDGTFTDSTPFVVDNTGNLGIGITAPASTLDIDTSSNTLGIKLRGLAETTEIGDIYMGSNGQLVLNTSNTGAAAAFIEVDAEDDNFGFIIRDSSTGSTVYSNLYMNDSTTDYLNIVVGAANSTAGLAIQTGGNIGIGVTSPGAKLDFTAAASGVPTIRIPTNNNYEIEFTGSTGANIFSGDLSDLFILAGSTKLLHFGSNGTNSQMVLNSGNVGIGDTAPDSALEVLSTTTPQFRLTYTDTTVDTTFAVSSTGDLTIDALGGGTVEQLILSDADVINIGGSGSSDVAYNVIGDSTSGAGTVDSDDDLYIEGNLEVDGTITGATAFNCTDCIDFDDLENTLDIDEVTTINTTEVSTTPLSYIADSITTGTGLLFSFDALTTGKGLDITSTSNAIDSGVLVNISSSATAATDTTLSADITNLSFSPIYSTAVTTPAVTGQVLDVSRSVTTNSSFASTLTLSGALASFSDSATQTTGTLTSTADVVRIAQNYTSNTGAALDITSAGTTGGFALRVNDDGTFTDSTPLVVDIAGNVGIGTTNPAHLLDIAKDQNTSTTARIINTTAGTAAYSALWTQNDQTNGIGVFGTASNSYTGISILQNRAFIDSNAILSGIVLNAEGADPIIFSTSSSEKMRIDGGGNVGIGTTAPAAVFEVVDTLATSPSAAEYGASFNITSAGSAAFNQQAGQFLLNAGYTGGNSTLALRLQNDAAGTGTAGLTGGLANYGFTALTSPTTAGWNIGVWGGARNSSALNAGVAGWTVTTSAGTNVSVFGQALNGATNVGGYFSLTNTAAPTFSSAALIANNGATTSPIFLAQDNATDIFAIVDGGNVGINDTGPDAKLEVLSTAEQLRLTNTDGTVDVRITLDSSGDLTLNASADGTGSETLTLTGFTTLSSALTTFNCTDCINADDLADNIDLTAATETSLTFTTAASNTIVFQEPTAAVGLADINVSTSTSNVRGLDQTFTFSGTADTNTAYGISNSLTQATVLGTTVGQTYYGIYSTLTKSGADTTSGTIAAYGVYSTVSNTETGGGAAATRNTYGGYFSATGDTDGTGTAYGLYAAAASADTNWGIYADAGDVLIDEDLVVGGSTSVTETLANTAFTLGGDDLFVAGTAGIEGTIYSDSGLVVGASTTYANGSIAQSSGETFTIGTTSANLTLQTTTAGDILLTPGGTDSVQLTSGVTTGTGTSSSLSLAANSLTTGTAFDITSTSNAIDSGILLNVSSSASAATDTTLSADITKLSFSPIYSTAVTTPAITGQVLDISRSVTTNASFVSTLTLSGALASFSDSATQTTGTLTSTADVVQISQNYSSNSGSALNITSGGGSSGLALRVNDDGTFTDSTPFVVNNTGNVGIGVTSPGAKLDVNGANSATLTNFTQNVANNAIVLSSTLTQPSYLPGLIWYTTDDNATKPKSGIWTQNTSSGSFIYLGTSDAYSVGITNQAIAINPSGNVGIGITAPNQDLAVLGSSATNETAGKQLLVSNHTLTTSEIIQNIATNDATASDEYFLAMRSDVDGTPDNEFLFRTDGTANADGSFTGGGADVAEMYNVVGNAQPGDLVSIESDTQGNTTDKTVILSRGVRYDSSIVGIVSTNPGLVAGFGDANISSGFDSRLPIALAGRVPTKVSLENGPIHRGDRLTSSSSPGVAMRATKAAVTIGIALESYDGSFVRSQGTQEVEREREGLTQDNEPIPLPQEGVGKIMVFVQPQLFDPDVYLTSTGDLKITGTRQEALGNSQTQNPSAYSLIFSASGQIIDRVGAFTELMVGRMKAGAIESKDLATEGFYTFQGKIDNLLVTTKLVSPIAQIDEIHTGIISPVPNNKDIVVKIGQSQSKAGSQPGSSTAGQPDNENGFGKLIVENANGTEVASIDETGNASFSGQLSANSLQTTALNSDTVVGRQLTVDEINAKKIYAGDQEISLEKIEELLKKTEAEQNTISQLVNQPVNQTSDDLSVSDLTTTSLISSKLYVTDVAAINSLTITSSATIGSDLVLQSTVNSNQLTVNSINTLSAPLQIQSLALAPVEVMSGKFKIATNGDVSIQGNVNIAGNLSVEGLTSTKELSTEKLIVASDSDLSNSTNLTNLSNTIETNATAGRAVIPAGVSEITINNANITDYTLVYVTPTSTTENKVLYVKGKENGKFVVGFTDPLGLDVEFNWWVIDVRSTKDNLTP